MRIIAATSQAHDNAIRAGQFRADLFYSLNQTALTVPPLAERRNPSGPAEVSGSGSSGWRKWAESDVQGARIGVGGVLRDRFIIEEAIGEGGMGLVFRARDQRLEEARDRNPCLAIKLLGDDFKSHPDVLISLQREARRMQPLSHPNIASVYDFV